LCLPEEGAQAETVDVSGKEGIPWYILQSRSDRNSSPHRGESLLHSNGNLHPLLQIKSPKLNFCYSATIHLDKNPPN